jgi:Phasin protein
MTHTDSGAENTKFTPAAMMRPEILDMARQKIESLLEVQKEMVHTLESINQDVFNRAKKEAELTAEFITKLTAARSVPDATTTYHEWASREMELLAADGRQLIVNGEKIMQASRRLFSNGATAS